MRFTFWQVQHLVKFMCHFLMAGAAALEFDDAGAGNVVIFNRICSWRVRKVALAARRVQFLRFLGRIILGSWSIGQALRNAIFQPGSKYSGDVGVMPVAWQRIVNDVSGL